MPENETPAAGDLVFKPCARAFFVYYVAIFLVLVGPRINPEVGLPVWLGTILGLIIIGAVIYQKYGTEYQVTSLGVARVWRWPSLRRQEITWENLGEIVTLQGLTQTMLKVGNISFADKSGVPKMFWFGLANPREVKDLINGKRP